ncbi:MAG TPA: hypothetical protein VN847_03450 [Streptosporangiaceae bacterium]|nr:hypothetical protein [Streptosporangiaceae bacterium]
MPTYSTPEPIQAVVEFAVGEARISASDRGDTVVEVRPSDANHDADVQAAERTRVEFVAGRLEVKGPKQRRPFGKAGSIDVTVALPTGSRLSGTSGMGTFRSEGQLGNSRLSTGAGDILLAGTGTLDANSGVGAVTVEEVDGTADVSTGSGRIRLGAVSGNAEIKNSNGDTWVGEVRGDLRVKSANGSVDVDRAQGGVEATTANGALRVGGLTKGSASLKTALGAVEIGIADGTAAQLDLHTTLGTVRNQMEVTDRPDPADQVVEVYARTGYGDITIRRS